MQLTAKLTQLLPIQTGNGKNGEWKKREIILRTFGDNPQEICVLVWGDNCTSPVLVVGSSINIEFYLSSSQYNGKWNTQVVLVDFLSTLIPNEITHVIEIRVEDILIHGNKHQFEEKLRNITRNYFHIIGRSNDNYNNLVCIGMKGSLDPSLLNKEMLLKLPIQIESSFRYGWKTMLFAEEFEIIKK